MHKLDVFFYIEIDYGVTSVLDCDRINHSSHNTFNLEISSYKLTDFLQNIPQEQVAYNLLVYNILELYGKSR